MGSPGAGKSTFYRRNLEPLGFERVNQDTLKTKDKCLKVADSLLENGKSVTVGEFLIGFYVLPNLSFPVASIFFFFFCYSRIDMLVCVPNARVLYISITDVSYFTTIAYM